MKKTIHTGRCWLLLCLLVMTLCLTAACSPAPADTGIFGWIDGSKGYDYSPDGLDPEYNYDSDDYAYNYPYSSEEYLEITENTLKNPAREPLTTFSLKVDTAAYTNVQRYIESGSLPPADAVRIEEMINYFSYDQTLEFNNSSPFAIYTELGPSPFDADKLLAFIRVRTKDIDQSELPSSNLTFLIDTSGSMDSYDKLPLLQEAFFLLVETLDEDDTVSIVTYAGSAGVLLDSVSGADQKRILRAIDSLMAGGSTAGAEGIQTAYDLARKNFKEGGNNRVILATDGDFNVGTSSIEGLEALISDQRDQGIYLSVLGFGTGNLRDSVMETLATNGNGNYAYINSVSTARKVLVEELAANLFTIADDVKAQLEFNPDNVQSYRLIGYENRVVANKDFNDDTKDAGEIGIGTDVVLLFELELYGSASTGSLKYGSSQPSGGSDYEDELFEVRIRYKDPGESESKLLLQPVHFSDITGQNSSDFNFASSVAGFGHLLRESDYCGDITIDQVQQLAADNLGKDGASYRWEYLQLLKQYQRLAE